MSSYFSCLKYINKFVVTVSILCMLSFSRFFVRVKIFCISAWFSFSYNSETNESKPHEFSVTIKDGHWKGQNVFPDTFLLNQRLSPAAPSVAVFAYGLLTETPRASSLLQISAEEACFLQKLCGIHKKRCFVGHPLQWNRMAFCCLVIECKSLEGWRKRERLWNSDWSSERVNFTVWKPDLRMDI